MSKVPIKRIVSGTPAKPSAWPWAALVGQRDDNGITFKCGKEKNLFNHVFSSPNYSKTINRIELTEQIWNLFLSLVANCGNIQIFT